MGECLLKCDLWEFLYLSFGVWFFYALPQRYKSKKFLIISGLIFLNMKGWCLSFNIFCDYQKCIPENDQFYNNLLWSMRVIAGVSAFTLLYKRRRLFRKD
ncbi:MAG: hypothetical protein CME70_12215 [Halobacteriovorax sp.]|nr:hypothetical protein [Halobacteriovorax sp.]